MRVKQGEVDACLTCGKRVVWLNKGTVMLTAEAIGIGREPGTVIDHDPYEEIDKHLDEEFPDSKYGSADYFSPEGRERRRQRTESQMQWRRTYTGAHGWYHGSVTQVDLTVDHKAIPKAHCSLWTQKEEYCNLGVKEVMDGEPTCGIHLSFRRRENERREQEAEARALRQWEAEERQKRYEIERKERMEREELERQERARLLDEMRQKREDLKAEFEKLTGLEFQWTSRYGEDLIVSLDLEKLMEAIRPKARKKVAK